MTKQETRLKTIEKRARPDRLQLRIFMRDIETGAVMVDGEEITGAEFERRYPNARVMAYPTNDYEEK